MTDTTEFPASGGGGGSRKLLLAAVAAVLSTALLRRQDLRVDPGLSCAQRNGRSPRVVGVYLLFVLAVACRWESGWRCQPGSRSGVSLATRPRRPDAIM